jgi:membrane protein YqaA with SNARE-associated domain
MYCITLPGLGAWLAGWTKIFCWMAGAKRRAKRLNIIILEGVTHGGT